MVNMHAPVLTDELHQLLTMTANFNSQLVKRARILGHTKTINFPFGKINVSRCPNKWKVNGLRCPNSVGTPKTIILFVPNGKINFPFGKINVSRCPNKWKVNGLRCPNSVGTPKTIILFVPNGKLMVLDVQLFNHIRVYQPLQINRLVCMFDDTLYSI